jgi:hypothetical protein
MTLHRAQILLDKQQHLRLEELARESGRSMSEVVRQIMDEHFDKLSANEATRDALAALDELDQMRAGIEARQGMLDSSALDESRDERDRELLGEPGSDT